MEYVLLQCVKEKSKLRVKMISSQPFIKGINCQFPRNIREEGKYYVVKSGLITLKKNFYSAMQKDAVVCSTFDMEEIKKYINDMAATNNKINPTVIYGDDDDYGCVMCLGDEKDIVFAPCGHFITCNGCSKLCQKCPLCGVKVLDLLKREEIAD